MMWPVLISAISTCVLGFTMGVLVGLSDSPVVSVLLPLIFSLAGGAGGFYAARIDLVSAAGRRVVGIAAIALILLCGGLLSGVSWGISSRAEGASWSVLTDPSQPLLSAELSGSEVAEWLLLDARLRTLGLDTRERRLLFDRLSEPPRSLSVDELGGEVVLLRETLEEILPPDGAVQRRDEWLRLVRQLGAIEELVGGGAPLQAPAVYAELARIGDDAYVLSDDADDEEYLRDSEIAAGLSRFRVRLSNLVSLGGGGMSAVEEANQRLESATPVMAGLRSARSLASVDP